MFLHARSIARRLIQGVPLRLPIALFASCNHAFASAVHTDKGGAKLLGVRRVKGPLL